MDFLGKHISGQYDAELAYIRSQVTEMGNLVENQLIAAIATLSSHDPISAQNVIVTDQQVNQIEIKIDEACVRIIAKRQPAAKDLRLIIIIIKTIAELERIGDSAKDICQIALQHFPAAYQPVLSGLDAMANHVRQMLHDTLAAFSSMDLHEAVRIYKEDKRVTDNYEAIIRQLMTFMMENPSSIPYIITALSCTRTILRISSRCQNICESIFYFVKGQDYRHVGDGVIDDLLNQQP